MTILHDRMAVDNPIELENEICRYNCQTKEELEELLWEEYGVMLVLNFNYEES